MIGRALRSTITSTLNTPITAQLRYLGVQANRHVPIHQSQRPAAPHDIDYTSLGLTFEIDTGKN